MPKNLKTAEQIATATEELHAKRVAAGVTNRLWVSNGGECVCDDHAGNYLTAGIKSKPKARTHNTPLGAWHAEVVRFDLMDELNEDLYCETCFKGLFPVYAKHVVPEAKPEVKKPAKPVAKPEVVEAPAEEVTEVPTKTAKKFFVWSDGEKSVCAKHMGPILKKAVAEAPRKRKHALSNGDWAKVEETGDNVCGRCLKMAKGETTTKAPATKGKKTLKKPAKKGTEQFYAIRFGDGYYMASYSSREMDYTVAFSEARRFKTYDGAEKIINRMREEYDAEDLTPLISVMRVTIDHDDRTKTRAQRMGVLAF